MFQTLLAVTRVSGNRILKMGKEPFFLRMETAMLGSGRMTNRMEKDCFTTARVAATRVSGKTISTTGRAKSFARMET